MGGIRAVPGLTRLVVGSAGVVVVVGSLVLSTFIGESTSYFAGDGAASMTMRAAGVALLAVGLALLAARPWWIAGVLAVVAAVTWFAPVWNAWQGGPPVVRTVGMLATLANPILLLHLLLGFPSGSARGRMARTVLGIGYTATAAVVALVAAFYDPFRDLGCWANCSDNVTLLVPAPRFADVVMLAGTIVVAGISWFAVARAVANAGARRAEAARWAIVFASVAFAVASTAVAAVDAGGGAEGPGSSWHALAQPVWAIGALLLALAYAWLLAIGRRRRRAIDEVVRSTGGEGSIELGLQRAVGDPDLSVAYWLPSSDRFVDRSGRTVAEPGPDTVARATVNRGGHLVAVITHSVAATELERELGPAVRVALENESLRAEVDAQLADLRSSRSRVVAAGDAHRRELERSLHDGAQQQLTVLALRLRALADASRSRDEPSADLLDRCVELARTALDELRDVAHGIYPTVLEHDGLSAALRTYATRAPIPVELGEIAAARLPSRLEITAYLFMVEAVEDAHRRGASHALLRADVDEHALAASVGDDADAEPSTPDRVLDRVGAVGGEVSSSLGMTMAVLPCGS